MLNHRGCSLVVTFAAMLLGAGSIPVQAQGSKPEADVTAEKKRANAAQRLAEQQRDRAKWLAMLGVLFELFVRGLLNGANAV